MEYNGYEIRIVMEEQRKKTFTFLFVIYSAWQEDEKY